jgi:hypothetical protein
MLDRSGISPGTEEKRDPVVRVAFFISRNFSDPSRHHATMHGHAEVLGLG